MWNPDFRFDDYVNRAAKTIVHFSVFPFGLAMFRDPAVLQMTSVVSAFGGSCLHSVSAKNKNINTELLAIC